MNDIYQQPLDQNKEIYPRGPFDTHPAFALMNGVIQSGYQYLAEQISSSVTQGLRVLVIDGFHGVDWDSFCEGLGGLIEKNDTPIEWVNITSCYKREADIQQMVEPFLGGDDPIFGTHYPLGIESFIDPVALSELRIKLAHARGRLGGQTIILYGPGAGCIELWDELWYVDIPKDFLQERARAGDLTNLGQTASQTFGKFYKHSYFVDWPVLNRHKRGLLPKLNLMVDLQDHENPAAMDGGSFRGALHTMSQSPFRVRPWFYPGPWGGKYMQGHMGLDPEQPNFAWSFELIVPENGLVFQAGDQRLECAFDFLMFQENTQVLGDEAARQFIYEWPIRLDYLDTIDGGHLSTQVHPRPDFIRRHFGETYTQDETYYIANAKPGAKVYLGLSEDCDLAEFRDALETSHRDGTEIDIDRYVHSIPAKPHDMFLIPNGTVHCSGEGNMVLEISATPYIFTFKIYDYLRRDLEDNLRPMNIDRAFQNLRTDRRASFIDKNYVVQPKLIEKHANFTRYSLYNRPETFYEVERVDFETEYEMDTGGRAWTLSIVEGQRVALKVSNGRQTQLAFLESLVIPAAAGNVKITNLEDTPIKLIRVAIKEGVGTNLAMNNPVD